MTLLYCDTETRSPIDIKAGAHRYAERAEVLLVTYAVDDGEAKAWDVISGDPMPDELKQRLEDESTTVVFHNAAFDRAVLREALGIELHPRRVHCTMAQAYAHALPGKLEKLCDALSIDAGSAKLKDGRRLIQLFCVPYRSGARSGTYKATPTSHPEEWKRFVVYGVQDIVALRAVHRKLPVWNYPGEKGVEHAIWQIDQIINDRGIAVDMDLVRGALSAVADEQVRRACRVSTITEGGVQSARQREGLLRLLLVDYGIELPDLRAATVEKALESELPGEVKALLLDRLAASTTSTAKYEAFARATNTDGRLRGTLQYAGAGRTMRWAGRLVQLQNLARPDLDYAEIEHGIEALKYGCAYQLTDDVMRVASNAVRGALIAPPGRKLVVADLANIEGRVAAFLADEKWKLDAFAAFDLGVGPDLYKLAYSKAFAVEVDSVDKNQRQVGKVMELFLQYAGGVGAFVTGAGTYRINLDALADAAYPNIPEDVIDEATSFHEWIVLMKGNTYGLSDKAFIVCDALKRLWRGVHPGITSVWSDLEEGFVAAFLSPKTTISKGRLKFRRDGSWIRILMPSGRYLVYPGAEVETGANGKTELSYMGVDQFTRKWTRISTYGGRLFENCCQRVARDVLADSLPRIETAGYAIVATVHDEIIAEAPDDATYTAEDMAELMSAVPSWATSMPLAAEGFECKRYRK